MSAVSESQMWLLACCSNFSWQHSNSVIFLSLYLCDPLLHLHLLFALLFTANVFKDQYSTQWHHLGLTSEVAESNC